MIERKSYSFYEIRLAYELLKNEKMPSNKPYYDALYEMVGELGVFGFQKLVESNPIQPINSFLEIH